MLKIGVIGLGGIAQKAYLPVMARMQDQVDWVLCTRNEEVLNGLQSSYNFKYTTQDIDDLIVQGVDAVFIHTPTETHAGLIKKFLEAQIHVYVDKPVSEDIDEVRALHQLAKDQGCILMTGFNRRSAPLVTQLKAVPNKTQIIIQKNRESVAQDTQFALFDMMIHVVDTMLYLMDEAIVSSDYFVTKRPDGTLSHALVILNGETCTAQASINMFSGGRMESLEVLSHSGHYRVENLDTMHIKKFGKQRIETFSDWTDTLNKRGFTQIIEHFIHCVETNTLSEVYSFESSVLSHEIIDALNKAA